MATHLLFSPERVEQLLQRHPTLARLLPPPHEEGEPAAAFPGVLRKTDREIYRWIANTTSYPHLLVPIAQLERVLAAGCEFDRLLKTRDRQQFVSDTAEVFVADDMLRRGYEVTTIKRSDTSAPDLQVAGHGTEMVIEVYSPRELTAVDDWVRDRRLDAVRRRSGKL